MAVDLIRVENKIFLFTDITEKIHATCSDVYKIC